MPSFVMVESAPAQPAGFDSDLSATEPESNGGTEQDENSSSEATHINNMLANNKEKTPMCLVNELARYNKIPHQYRLTNEQGPAHRKQFTVTLKLGEEEYTAEGASIKKAQHQAAGKALSKTSYKHPPSKPRSTILRMGKNNITPTVELNAWAMKRGELATYHMIPPHALPANPLPPIAHVGPPCPAMPPGVGPIPNYITPMGPPPHPHFSTFPGYGNFRTPFNQMRPPNLCGEIGWCPPRPPINMYPRPPLTKHQQERMFAKPSIYPGGHPTFTVMVKVGSREFIGEGATAQLARHDAASKALSEIRQLPLPDEKTQLTSENGCASNKEESGSEIKSPISLVHEVALRRNLPVKFEVVRVTGPPHMRSFHTLCVVGEFETEGVGNGKKLSKKRASEKMLEELKKLPPESPCVVSAAANINPKVKRKPVQKKRSRNLVKDPKPASPVESPMHSSTTEKEKEGMNPISLLIQIQQAKKEQEPSYSLVEEKGAPRRREFVMAVTIGEKSCQGSGPNKKLAKRAAAEAMLLELGYSQSSQGPSTGSAAKSTNGKETRKAVEVPIGGTSGRQLVPGILLVPDPTFNPPIKGTVISPATSSMAKELLQSRQTADSQSSESTSIVSPKDQLLYLAQLLDFKVQFSDFPKGNHREYLSLVTLSTSPPHVCHGAGQTLEASHDEAALIALQMLAEMGLDMFSNNKAEAAPSSPTPPNATDGSPKDSSTTEENKGN